MGLAARRLLTSMDVATLLQDDDDRKGDRRQRELLARAVRWLLEASAEESDGDAAAVTAAAKAEVEALAQPDNPEEL